MGRKNIFLILLLATLGLNIFGDLFSITNSKMVNNEQTYYSSAVEVIAGAANFNQSGSQDCNDISNHGDCHMGHCSHLYLPEQFTSSYIYVLENSVNLRIEYKSPFLNGHKRPPRVLS